MPKTITIDLQSGVNEEGEPFVHILSEGRIACQMTPKEARGFASDVLEISEEAEQDAFIRDWAINDVGMTPNQAAGFLREFRLYRRQKSGKKGGPVDKEDFVMPEKEDMHTT